MRDLIVKIAVKLGIYLKLVEYINKIKFIRQSRLMRRYGLEMLAEADKAFSSMNVRAFLSYGALLGAYRDHGFIPYDPDIDLGILSTEIPNNMNEILKQHGFRLIRRHVMENTCQVVESTYSYKGLHLDVFVYFEDGPDFFSIVSYKHETKDWKEANQTDGFPTSRRYVPKSDFERRDFLGIQIWMPVDTDGWLRALYSDSYMSPVKNWEPTKKNKTRTVWTKDRSYREIYE